MNAANLYVILDREVNTQEQLFEIARCAIAAGADMLQLRDKRGTPSDILDFAGRLAELARGKALFIVNDSVDAALASGAAGVHLGQTDMALAEARSRMGREAIIGISCQTLEQAQKAQDGGADYIGLGSVFKTFTKPGRTPMDTALLQRIVREITIPVFAIGGITLDNLNVLMAHGVSRVAVCREICLADQVEEVVRRFINILRPGLARSHSSLRG